MGAPIVSEASASSDASQSEYDELVDWVDDANRVADQAAEETDQSDQVLTEAGGEATADSGQEEKTSDSEDQDTAESENK